MYYSGVVQGSGDITVVGHEEDSTVKNTENQVVQVGRSLQNSH